MRIPQNPFIFFPNNLFFPIFFFDSKLRYIRHEMFGDFNYYLWGTFEFYLAVFIYLFALWIRIYVHYLAQYLYIVVSCNCHILWDISEQLKPCSSSFTFSS